MIDWLFFFQHLRSMLSTASHSSRIVPAAQSHGWYQAEFDAPPPRVSECPGIAWAGKHCQPRETLLGGGQYQPKRGPKKCLKDRLCWPSVPKIPWLSAMYPGGQIWVPQGAYPGKHSRIWVVRQAGSASPSKSAWLVQRVGEEVPHVEGRVQRATRLDGPAVCSRAMGGP